MTTGERIKRSREQAGLSQTELAAMIKVSKQSLYKYENDIVKNIPLSVISDLANALGVSPSYLANFEDIHLVISDTDPQVDQILSNAKKLNAQGLARLEQYSEDLTGNPIYQKKTMPK